jgi:CheY-like chemotaxis protein
VWDVVAGPAPALRSTDIWESDDSSFAALFRQATDGVTFAPGEGLPGEVLVSGQPVFVPAIGTAANFPRQRMIRTGSAIGFPVLVGGDPVAVFEVLSEQPQIGDPDLLSLLSTIGRQLGQVVSRARLTEAQLNERQRLESEVRDRTAELDASLRSARELLTFRADLIAALNHDLRTPLHQLSGAVASLVEHLPRNPDVQSAREAADTLEHSVVQLMDLYAAEEHGGPGDALPTEVDLADLVREAIALATETGGAEVVQLRTVPGTNLVWAVQAAEVISGVGALIDSVRSPGTEVITVDLAVVDQTATVTVAPGTRSRDRQNAVSNRGLPLARAHLSATRLGGAVRGVASDSSGVTLAFPLQPAVRHAEDLGRRVLLVDDNTATRKLAAAMLSRLGLQTVEAVDGLDALSQLESGQFGLVFMDCNMPNLDGYQATSMIRAGEAGPRASGVPIVALTADGGEGHWEKCRRFGMSDFLSKPFRLADLDTMVQRWLPPGR